MPNMPQDDWSDFAKEAGPDTQQPDMVSAAKADRNGWRKDLNNVPEFKTVLVQHKDDLYPVPAYKVPDVALNVDTWLRETEGPEDAFYGGGRHEPLFRTPTHWQPLPAPPEDAE